MSRSSRPTDGTGAADARPQLLALTYIPLIIFSGGFGGLAGLPSWVTTLMSYLPAKPMIDLVTQAGLPQIVGKRSRKSGV